MIHGIIRQSIRLRYLVIILAVVLMFFGIFQLGDMPVDVYPEFNPPLVEVQTEALGLSATEVEALLTVPMEADLLNGVAWLENIYSDSVAGLSSILMVFEPGTDPIRARQMVQERLTEAYALPNVSTPPTMMQPLSTTSRVDDGLAIFRRSFSDRYGSSRPLEYCPALNGRPWRGQCRHLGTAGVAAAGAG